MRLHFKSSPSDFQGLLDVPSRFQQILVPRLEILLFLLRREIFLDLGSAFRSSVIRAAFLLPVRPIVFRLMHRLAEVIGSGAQFGNSISDILVFRKDLCGIFPKLLRSFLKGHLGGNSLHCDILQLGLAFRGESLRSLPGGVGCRGKISRVPFCRRGGFFRA
ncbi:hypothetical protein [uncultured Desulfovibrio sp.]|uniref:hypothetical protein n=1 Tax=uncultured Desulfovibrio sp. TaxID=167968 RepID=UPI0026207814|nr:hypothetical protein [uncultured Desulfovibrio sp.]